MESHRPLEDWLIEENKKNGVKVGWTVPDYGKYCSGAARGMMSWGLLALSLFIFTKVIY